MPVFTFWVSTAEANIFSFFSGLFKDVKSEAKSIESENLPNSQNISILESNLNPLSNIGGGDVVIVDNTAIEFQDEPSNETQTDQISVYKVRKGDTLSQIAKMFDVSVNTIIWANDIERGIIAEGQTLIILPVTGIKHKVEKGETIEKIAKKYGGDLEEILQFNNLTKDSKLATGDELIIPDGELGSKQNSNSGSIATNPIRRQNVSDGYYLRPVIGGRKTQGLHGNNGVDLGGLPIGSRVSSAAEGIVIGGKNSGWNGGYGTYIVISHPNGTQTLYGHLNQNVVTVGQKVEKGQLIGYLGNTGRSSGPHLHFEVRGARNPF